MLANKYARKDTPTRSNTHATKSASPQFRYPNSRYSHQVPSPASGLINIVTNQNLHTKMSNHLFKSNIGIIVAEELDKLAKGHRRQIGKSYKLLGMFFVAQNIATKILSVFSDFQNWKLSSLVWVSDFCKNFLILIKFLIPNSELLRSPREPVFFTVTISKLLQKDLPLSSHAIKLLYDAKYHIRKVQDYWAQMPNEPFGGCKKLFRQCRLKLGFSGFYFKKFGAYCC